MTPSFRGVRWPAAGLAAVLLAAVAAPAGEAVPWTRIPASDYASFPVNWSDDTAAVRLAVIRSPEEYAAVFHPAPVMGNRRPFAPSAEFFADAMLLVVARVIDAPAAADEPLAVESLTEDGADLELRYRFTPPSIPATFTVKEVLQLRVPRRSVARIRFIENGEPAGDLQPAAGAWVVPPPAAE